MRAGARVSTRRAVLLSAAAALLAGNLGFFLWYRSTARDRKDGMEARRTALTREVESGEEETSRLTKQRDRLSQVSSAIEEFYGRRVGTRRETLAPVVEEIHAVLRRADVSPTQISYATARMEGLPLSEMVVTFAFKADYSKIKQLLAGLEAERRWIVIRDIALSRDTDLPGSVQVRMTLATYFSGEEKPVPRISLPRSRRP